MMDPLTTNGIVPALMGMFEKRNEERAPALGRKQKRTKAPASAAQSENEQGIADDLAEDMQELGRDAPKHALDDLA
jgi:hypothetical protein